MFTILEIFQPRLKQELTVCCMWLVAKIWLPLDCLKPMNISYLVC